MVGGYGSPSGCSCVLAKILTFAHSRDFVFVIWFAARAYDALWERIRETSPESFRAWRHCGLVSGERTRRPAYDVWRQHLGLRRGSLP